MRRLQGRRALLSITIAAVSGLLGLAAFAPSPLLCASGVGVANAQSSRATLYVVAGDIPRSITTAAALVRHARSHRARTIPEGPGEPLESRHWRGNVVMSFSGAIGVRNLTMLTYDVTGGARDLTGSSVDIFVRNVADTIIVTAFDLPRTRFRPDREVEFVVTRNREPVGSVRARLTGEPNRGNGSLDFTQADPEHPAPRR